MYARYLGKSLSGFQMIVAFTNLKGGVGKSTLAVHSAAWLHERGRRLILVDADVQGSSSAWLSEAVPEIRVVRILTPDDVLNQIPVLAQEADDLVVDGPGGLAEVTRAILLLADKAILPCRPSLADLRPVHQSIQVIRQVQAIRKGPPETIFVPNCLRTRQRLSKELISTAADMKIRVSNGIRDLNAYPDAVGQGTLVWRMPRQEHATAELFTLFEALFNDNESAASINVPRFANA